MGWKMELYRWSYVIIGIIMCLAASKGIPTWIVLLFCSALIIITDLGVEEEFNKKNKKNKEE